MVIKQSCEVLQSIPFGGSIAIVGVFDIQDRLLYSRHVVILGHALRSYIR